MNRRRIAVYFIIHFLGVLLGAALVIYWPAVLYVSENTESTDNATLIGGPMVQIGNTDGSTSIVIAWRTRGKSDSRVDFGESASYGQRVIVRERTDRHAVVLPYLQPNKRYYYQIASNDKVLASAAFQTGKIDDMPFKFAVFGDSGFGTEHQNKVAEQVERVGADFILHTGDVVYPEGEEKDYQNYFYLPYKNLIARVPFFPTLGNHDLETANGQPWLNNFVLPGAERFYSFSYGNAFLVALDSHQVNPDSARWLEGQLAGTEKLWKFVFFHKPPFSNHRNRHGSGPARRLWVSIFEKYRVDIVFSGHDHLYTRFQPKNGVVYIVEGAGGRSLYRVNPHAKEVVFTNNTQYGFGLVDIAGPELVFRHFTADGTVLDTFTLTK